MSEMPIYYFCRNCLHIGRSRIIRFSGIHAELRLSDNWETCENCGEMA